MNTKMHHAFADAIRDYKERLMMSILFRLMNHLHNNRSR